MLNWNATKEEHKIIGEIYKRFSNSYNADKMDFTMDIEAAHSNGCKLDLAKLLDFPQFDFLHDIHGIMNNIDRNTGKLRNCFLPRCAR